MMNTGRFHSKILKIVKAETIESSETIQSLWSDYGVIQRLRFLGGACQSAIVKMINLRPADYHPRGWNTDRSHQRKMNSYEVEKTWYQGLNNQCGYECLTPKLLGSFTDGEALVLILEDLHLKGLTQVKQEVDLDDVEVCVRWLSSFHGTFLGQAPQGLWQQGSYWHLNTRPDEWQAMKDGFLKEQASSIDEYIHGSPFKTLIHGDAKLANFCFHPEQSLVGAVDFQYVGGGCGMIDLAYFMGSCLSSKQCFEYETWILELYFKNLRKSSQYSSCESVPWDLLEQNWRSLYPYAWADFQGFLEGWKPGHWKIHDYSQSMVAKVGEERA